MNKDLTLRKADHNDLDAVADLFTKAIQTMNDKGIHQWDDIYPSKDILEQDIADGTMYLALIEDRIVSVFVLNRKYDSEYDDGAWEYKDASFYVVHRLCVNPELQGKGIGKRTMLLIEDILREKGIETIRLDAFSQNPVAVRMYESLGYKKTGEAHWRKGLFYLYEKKL